MRVHITDQRLRHRATGRDYGLWVLFLQRMHHHRVLAKGSVRAVPAKHATRGAAKLASCSTVFLALGIGRWIRTRIWVASGLRILPDLFGICRVKLLICFRISRAI